MFTVITCYYTHTVHTPWWCRYIVPCMESTYSAWYTVIHHYMYCVGTRSSTYCYSVDEHTVVTTLSNNMCRQSTNTWWCNGIHHYHTEYMGWWVTPLVCRHSRDDIHTHTMYCTPWLHVMMLVSTCNCIHVNMLLYTHLLLLLHDDVTVEMVIHDTPWYTPT